MKFISFQLLKRSFLSIILSLSLNSVMANTSKDVYVTMGQDMAMELQSKNQNIEILESFEDIALLKANETELHSFSHLAHESFHRCGGFMVHKNFKGAQKELAGRDKRLLSEKAIFADYSIDQHPLVQNLMNQVQESSIRQTILKLSSYRNRYYKSQTGVESQSWLFNHWRALTQRRSDISVERFQHNDWPQDTITATIKGQSDDIIVVGGHADSVAGWWNRSKAEAPGADDNASGIATMTEVLRLLVQNNYKPEKTIVFAGYAAEEVGLLGSKEMARAFKDANKNVVGVLQLDMTNFNGSDWDIVLVSDYTNEEQNKFIGSLIDTYLQELNWGYDRCGYACSDHASWNSVGYPASMPFEAKKSESNRNIHTSRDTISKSGGHAEHAQKFAKMALAFVVELDK